MAFCEQCGAALSASGGACESCGYLRAQPAAPETAAPAPPPPPGYQLVGASTSAAPAAFTPSTPASAFAATSIARPRYGFLVALPPLAGLAAIVGATFYAGAYELIRWGEVGTLSWFLTGAGPGVLSYVTSGSDYFTDGTYMAYGLAGSALGLIAAMLVTVILASLSRAGAGSRLLAGALVSAGAAIFATVLVLINHSLLPDYSFYPLGEQIAKGAGGAAIVGLAGGLLGALLSLAVRRPPASGTTWPSR